MRIFVWAEDLLPQTRLEVLKLSNYYPCVSTRELIDKEVSSLPEPLQREVYDFARFLREKSEDDSFNGLLLSESARSKD